VSGAGAESVLIDYEFGFFLVGGLSLAVGERVTFFAGAKKVTKESTFKKDRLKRGCMVKHTVAQTPG
jgi:hypothetical protein